MSGYQALLIIIASEARLFFLRFFLVNRDHSSWVIVVVYHSFFRSPAFRFLLPSPRLSFGRAF
jgi:hypothetical protein